jgi:membrane protease YdiL (CAAX protease family)
MWVRLAIAAVLEIVYAVFTRTWLRAHFSGIELELWVTACRLLSFGAYCLLFRSLLTEPRLAHPSRSWPWLGAGIALMLVVPSLFYGGYPDSAAYRTVFALTSVVVGAREELLYRGVIQTLLARRLSFPLALIASNVVFVLYHYGAQPLHLVGITEIFAFGCLMGLIYRTTGRLLIPISLHAVYDALWSLGPLVTPPPSDYYRIPFQLVALYLVLIWTRTRLE